MSQSVIEEDSDDTALKCPKCDNTDDNEIVFDRSVHIEHCGIIEHLCRCCSCGHEFYWSECDSNISKYPRIEDYIPLSIFD